MNNFRRTVPGTDSSMVMTIPEGGGGGRSDSSADGLRLPRGTCLGEFEIDGILGEGGFSVVYSAHDRSLGRAVAIKEYMPSSIATRMVDFSVQAKGDKYESLYAKGIDDFVREAQTLARFDHPGLVKVFRVWRLNGTAYMAMPLYRGVTLRNHLASSGGFLGEGDVVALLDDLISVLAYVHQRNCLHRDIAPDNVLILENGRPLLLDFGAARQLVGEMTQALTVILKPGYAPPEQYASDASIRQGPWTDVYALGAVAWYCITGRSPPTSIERILSDRMPSLVDVAQGRVSPQLSIAVANALALNVESRTKSVLEFREAILKKQRFSQEISATLHFDKSIVETQVPINTSEQNAESNGVLDDSEKTIVLPGEGGARADSGVSVAVAPPQSIPVDYGFSQDLAATRQADQPPTDPLLESEGRVSAIVSAHGQHTSKTGLKVHGKIGNRWRFVAILGVFSLLLIAFSWRSAFFGDKSSSRIDGTGALSHPKVNPNQRLAEKELVGSSPSRSPSSDSSVKRPMSGRVESLHRGDEDSGAEVSPPPSVEGKPESQAIGSSGNVSRTVTTTPPIGGPQASKVSRPDARESGPSVRKPEERGGRPSFSGFPPPTPLTSARSSEKSVPSNAEPQNSAEEIRRIRGEAEARIELERKARLEAETRANAEADARAEAERRRSAEAEQRARAENEARQEASRRRAIEAEQRTKAESDARAAAEQRSKTEAEQRKASTEGRVPDRNEPQASDRPSAAGTNQARPVIITH